MAMSLEVFTWIIKKSCQVQLLKIKTALIDALKQIDETANEYIDTEKCIFYQKFCSLEDGQASQRICQTIFK